MYTNNCFCRFGQIDVYIRTDQILFQIDVIIKVVALVYFQNTIVLRKGTCNVIPGYFATSRNIQIGSLITSLVNIFIQSTAGYAYSFVPRMVLSILLFE